MESFMKRALSALKTVFDFDVKLGYNTFASTMRLAPPELSLFVSWVLTSYRDVLRDRGEVHLAGRFVGRICS